MLVVVPHSLRAPKRVNGMKDTKFFYYRLFKEIHLRKTDVFDYNPGRVVFVLPSTQPPQATLDMRWLRYIHVKHRRQCCAGCYALGSTRQALSPMLSVTLSPKYNICLREAESISGRKDAASRERKEAKPQ